MEVEAQDAQGGGGSEGARARSASPRFHDLDALRAAAMLLGIVLHAALFFMPDYSSEEYSAEEYPAQVSGIYTLILFAIHGFRMPVFFLLSGFFTAMLWRRRGLRQLAAHRLKRVGIPLAIGAVTVIPATTWAFLWAFESRETVRPWEYLFVWTTTLSHLWFLWVLLWLAAGFIAAAKLGVRFSNPVLWWLAIPLTLVPQWFMDEPVFGPDTSDGLVVDPDVLAFYALFFVLGAFFYQGKIAISPWWTAALIPAMTVVFVGGLTFLYEVKAEWAKPVADVFQVAFAWMTCFGLMGLFRLIASRERPWVRYLSDASYWLYLWHLPLLVVFFKLSQGWPINLHLRFGLLCVAATAALLAAYHLGVRYTPVGTMLNGRRLRTA